MTIAKSIKDYLESQGAKYDVIMHSHTASSMETAQAAHVSGDAIAKAIVLKDEKGYLMAVLPATHHIEMGRLNEWLQRDLGMVPEEELAGLFADCEPGAVPPLGDAYRMEMVMDENLVKEPDIYFEAGNHYELVHMQGMQFDSIEAHARWGVFSRHS